MKVTGENCFNNLCHACSQTPGHVNRHEQVLDSGKLVGQCTRASLQPSTYEEMSTACMSHTEEIDFGNSTPTKSVFKQDNVETS